MTILLLTVIGSPANAFYGEFVIVCVDSEGWQGSSYASEIGITVVDTRELVGLPLAGHYFTLNTTKHSPDTSRRYLEVYSFGHSSANGSRSPQSGDH